MATKQKVNVISHNNIDILELTKVGRWIIHFQIYGRLSYFDLPSL